MLYQVKAVRGEAEIVVLPIEAVDAKDAERRTLDQGYDVLAVTQNRFALGKLKLGSDKFPVLMFAQELVALLEAGLNLVAALEALGEKENAPAVRQVIDRVVELLRQGEGFAQALQEFPHIFPPLFIATVRSNEKTGGLVEALARYAHYHKQMDEVRAKLVSALIYPALLFVVGSGVALFLMFYVVPKFRRVFEDMGGDLPFFSRMLVEWGRAVDSYGALVALLIVAMVACVLVLGARTNLKVIVARRVLELPGIGERLKLYQFARFFRTLGMLTRSGIPLSEAMGIAAELLSAALRTNIASAGQAIREGMAFSEAMSQYGLTTPIAFRLLRVGEHSGNMAEMLERIATLFEEQISRWVERFTKLFEPFLMAAIGVVIGVIVVFLYMPIFELAGSVQ
jgi:general secretion pathway protein F